jgi:hypothetical protein
MKNRLYLPKEYNMEQPNIQMDLATMALKGKRYMEAESIYMQIATQTNSPEAWVGMGVCKLYQLADGRTMDEVIFCINKAKQLNPDLKLEIENQLIINCQILLNAYLNIFEQSLVKHQELKRQAMTGAILAGVSMAVGSNSKSTFNTIASLAGTGAGVGVAVDAFNKMDSLNEIRNYILSKCDEIHNGLKLNIDTSNQTWLEYNGFVNKLIANVQSSIELNHTSGKWYMDKNKLIIITIFVWPVGLYGWYLRSKKV